MSEIKGKFKGLDYKVTSNGTHADRNKKERYAAFSQRSLDWFNKGE